MILEERHHELIDKFLLQSLNDYEQKEFEQLIKDTDFQAEVLFREDLLVATQTEGRTQLKARLTALEQNATMQNTKEAKRISMFRVSLAAAAILLIGIFMLRFLFIQNIDKETIVAQYFEPYPNIIAPLHRGEAATDSLSLAMSFYENKDYNKAIVMLKQLKQQDETDFYIAQMLLFSKQYAEANNYFEILSRHDNRFKAAAEWYAALSNLALGKNDLVKQQLSTIAQNKNHLFYAKAKELMDKLP